MSPMCVLIYLCAVAHVASQTNDVQNFTCEALRTVYQINNCCTQGCAAPPIITSENPKWNITIKNVVESRSGMLHYAPVELHAYFGREVFGFDVWESQPIFDMMTQARNNQWPNNTQIYADYDGRSTVTQMILSKPLYGLHWPPGGPIYAPNDDISILIAAIGVKSTQMGIPNVRSGAEYIFQKILAPLENTLWLGKGQLAAPSDVNDRMSELMVGRAATFPPEYNLYTVPRDPSHVYIDGEGVWASDVPNDGFALGDTSLFYVTEKTNSTDDYLTGDVQTSVAGSLQDLADLCKLCMRGGMHRKTDGTLVKVLSPEAVNYALRFINGPFHPGDLPAGFFNVQSAPRVLYSPSRVNGCGFIDDEEDPFLGDYDRLKRGKYVNLGTYGMGFCFDMETGEYTINSATQTIWESTGWGWFLRFDCTANGVNQTQAQQLVDAFDVRPSVALLVGKMDDYEFFVYKNEMRKGEQPTRNNLYYRFGTLGGLLGRLTVSAAFVDDRMMYEDELLAKYIPEYTDLEALAPGPPAGLCEPGVLCQEICLPDFYPDCFLGPQRLR